MTGFRPCIIVTAGKMYYDKRKSFSGYPEKKQKSREERIEYIMASEFLSDLAAGLEPYVPGEQPKDKKYIKLNTNENPYPPSAEVIRAIEEETANLRLYPDPDATAVRTAAAEYYNDTLNLAGTDRLTEDNIFVGNGSDEVLAFLFPTFFKGKKIAFADIPYSFYPVYAALFEVSYDLLPLKEDFSLDMEQYCGGLAGDIRGILICNPNAPTGRALPLADVERILDANSGRLVVVDEAYVDFGAETAAGVVNRHENLVVTQTLSKSRQLAGMRVGIAIASAPLIAGLNAVKNSFNSYTADRLAIAAAAAAFRDREYFETTRRKIMETRELVTKEFRKLGFDVLPSAANFLFVEPVGISAADLFGKLRERGILVRYFPKPRIDRRLRITVGTQEEMDALMASVREILKEC